MAAYIDDWDSDSESNDGRDSEEPGDSENFEFEDDDWGDLL